VPAAEIAAAITSFRASLEIAKAMIGLRDEEAFRAKSIELQGAILQALEKSIEAREAYGDQANRIRGLEAEIGRLKSARIERERYEPKSLGSMGVFVFMLKPDTRGSSPPHWICPNCLGQDFVSPLQPTPQIAVGKRMYECPKCNMAVPMTGVPKWVDDVNVEQRS
jgi:hypothetical protein